MEWLQLALRVACMVALLKVQGSSAIECFECFNCINQFGDKTPCSATFDACAKVIKGGVVSRRCYKTGIVGEGCNKGNFEETCICKKDLCNGSTIVTASTSVMAALALMVGILTRM